MAANSKVQGLIWQNFKSIRDFVVVLVTCKNEEEVIKNEGARVVTTLSIEFLRRSRAANSDISDGILPKFQLIQAFMVGLVICKNEEDLSKMTALEWSQYFSNYKSMGIFPDAQGQLTHKSLVRSWRISNLINMLWLSSSPARIKKNQLEVKELEWSQGFPHYNLVGAICCHGNQSSHPIWLKVQCSQSPTQMMLQMKFD